MSKVYRFHWDYYIKAFEKPENLGQLNSDDRRKKMESIVRKFAHRSGISPMNGCIFLFLFLLIFAGMMAAAFYTLPHNIGKALVISGPFIAFACIVYLMCRKSPILRVNTYMDRYRNKLETEASAINLMISCQFVVGELVSL